MDALANASPPSPLGTIQTNAYDNLDRVIQVAAAREQFDEHANCPKPDLLTMLAAMSTKRSVYGVDPSSRCNRQFARR